MKILLATSFVAALLLATPGNAQTSSSGATFIGTMTASAEFPAADGGTPSSTKPKGTRATNEILIWRTSDGQTKYSMNVSNIRVEDFDGTVNVLSTDAIVDGLTKAAAIRGYELGYTRCADMYVGANAEVKAEARVGRSGTGNSTTFFTYDPSLFEAKSYSIHCQSTSGSTDATLQSETLQSSSGTIQ